MSKVTTSTEVNGLVNKIFIDGHLHMSLDREAVIGMTSWIDKGTDYPYKIEIFLSNGQKMEASYSDRKLWEDILGALDEML